MRAVNDVAAPTVSARAAELGRMQHPGIQTLSAGSTVGALPVVEIASPAAVRVRVAVDPGAAATDVRRITLWSDDNAWRRVLPVVPATQVQMPHDSRLPTGLPVAVRCTVQPGGRWAQPTQQEFVTDHDRDVVFRLEPPPTPGDTTEVVINTVGPYGNVVPAMSSSEYEDVERIIEPLGVTLDRRETGPALRLERFERSDRLREVAFDIAEAINESTPSDIGAVVRGIDGADVVTSLELEVTRTSARRLGGLLEDEQVVEIGISLDLHVVSAPYRRPGGLGFVVSHGAGLRGPQAAHSLALVHWAVSTQPSKEGPAPARRRRRSQFCNRPGGRAGDQPLTIASVFRPGRR
jgi:hypothetical protein